MTHVVHRNQNPLRSIFARVLFDVSHALKMLEFIDAFITSNNWKLTQLTAGWKDFSKIVTTCKYRNGDPMKTYPNLIVDKSMAPGQISIQYEVGGEKRESLVFVCEFGHIDHGSDSTRDCQHPDCVVRDVLET